MRKIQKGQQPESFDHWIRSNPGKRYNELPHEQRRAIRAACIEEQLGLCAYCCHAIAIDSAHNEHVDSQSLAPARTLDFSNIVASCNHPDQCGAAHKSRALPLTALMDECETEFKFFLSGAVKGLTSRADTAIKVLNLGDTRANNLALYNARKTMIESLLFTHSIDPSGLALESEEVLTLLREELQQPDKHNRLLPFAPVLVNVLRQNLQPSASREN